MAEYTGQSSNFLSATYDKVDAALNTFVTGFSANIASEIAPIVGSGLTLTFIAIGILAVRGMLDRPFSEVAYKIFVTSIITTFALTTAVYQQYVVDIFLTLPDDLITSIVAGSITVPDGGSVAVGHGAAQAIEQLYTAGSYNAGLYFNEAGMTNLPPILYGSLIWLGTILCVFIGTLWLFVSKIVLALMLGVGPIFIVLLCWEKTQQFFWSWLGVVVNTVITSIFVVAIFAIFAAVFKTGLTNLSVDNSSEGFINAAVYTFLGLICMGVLMTIPQYVTQLTGAAMGAVGTAAGSLAGKAAGAVGGAAGGAVGAVRGGVAANDAMKAYQSARQGGSTTYQGNREGKAGRMQALREARREYHGSMAEMKRGYPDYYRNKSSNTEKK